MKIGDQVMYNGLSGRIVGRTYSHRNFRGGFYYDFLPDGARNLWEAVQLIAEHKLSPIEAETVTYVAGAYGAAMPIYHKPQLVRG